MLISPHSAFLTAEALANIAATTVQNLKVITDLLTLRPGWRAVLCLLSHVRLPSTSCACVLGWDA